MDVDQLKQLIQQYFINPLNALPIKQIEQLDSNHDLSVQDFEAALSPLWTAPGLAEAEGQQASQAAFAGKGADAFADYIGKYLNAEGLFSDYQYASVGGYNPLALTDRVSTLLSKCAAALADEESLLKSLQSGNAWGVAGATAVAGEEIAAPVEGAAPPDIPVIQLMILISAAVVLVVADANQQNQIMELTQIMNTWVEDMKNLANQADPQGSQLPGPPSQIEPAIVMDTNQLKINALGASLTPDQERLVEKLAQEYNVSAEEIAEILSLDPTVNEAQLRQKIERYLQLRMQYPDLAAKNPQLLLWAAAFSLTDPSVAEQIVNANPGLTNEEYALLIQYCVKYGLTGNPPYNVMAVFTGVDQKGKEKIYYLTQGDLAHIRDRHADHLSTLSNDELFTLIQELLQEKPDKVRDFKKNGYVDYYYNDVYSDERYITVRIRISTTTPGRVISVFEDWD